LDANSRTPDFVKASHIFAENHKSCFIFRILKTFLKCDDFQLQFLISKIYCLSIKSSQKNSENPFKTYFGILFSPFYILLTKDLHWKRERVTDYNFETVDEQYFNKRFAVIYESLRGSKRITPRLPGTFQRDDVTKTIFSSACLGTTLQLFLLSWIVFIPLLIFCVRIRLNILRAYREVLSIYVLFNAYFQRYPCKHFITYADDTNHPSRYLAFKRGCPGKFAVIQNGERGYHPSWSFGMLDYYFTFGTAYVTMARQLSYHMEDAFPVGSLGLNQYYGILEGQNFEQKFDILYIDNGSIYPPNYGGLEETVAKSEEIIFSHLSKFKARHKNCNIAYQLRFYGDDLQQKNYILNILKKYFPEGILVVDNDGSGESYKNMKRSKLVMTFQSTMGFESMMLGVKTLFVNYSGYKSETYCDDSRFQIDDPGHDYILFEQKVEDLLFSRNTDIPEIAYERHFLFDGKVQERIATILNDRLGYIDRND